MIGGAALILFGPDKLPGIVRQVGRVTREVQSTGQSFIREIERAADETPAMHEMRRIREQGMNPEPPDYGATIANRPPRISEEPLYDPIVDDPVASGANGLADYDRDAKKAEMRTSRPIAEDDLRD